MPTGAWREEIDLDLPLLLAGPILRRVEPRLVSVWVALSEPASLTLSIWEGLVPSGRGDPFATSNERQIPDSLTADDEDAAGGESGKSEAGENEGEGTGEDEDSDDPERKPPLRTRTLRLGERLHLALVTVRIAETSAKRLEPDRLYSYDLDIRTGDGNKTLADLGLLSAADDAGTHVPLGFEPNMLPGFALPPSALDDLRLLYGSCRRPGHSDPDALAWIDDHLVEDDVHPVEGRRYKDPRQRPHQLFLGGDQVYADDVDTLHLLLLTKLGNALIGTRGPKDEPVERIALDGIERREQAGDDEHPFGRYVAETTAESAADPALPADRARFPEDQRGELVRRAAQFTTSDGNSHLISIGEFAAAYLTVWSDACWGEEIPKTHVLVDPDEESSRRALRWDDALAPASRIELPPREFPERRPRHLFPEKDGKPAGTTPEQRKLHEQLRLLDEFRRGLPKVRRVLANIPTYMIFDDHDLTDDFFLNPIWRDRVLGTALGQTIMHNGMLTYALFQDWGNDPLRYAEAPCRDLLVRAEELFPSDADAGPAPAARTALAHLFGHDLSNSPRPDGTYAPVAPPIPWHFSVDGTRHRVVALDNRTRRSYRSRNGPPGNVSVEALAEQIPKPPLPSGIDVLVVVSPLQVIGPPVLDDIIGPLSYRVFDAKAAIENEPDGSATGSPSGLREMLGTDPDAIEAWALDGPTFEHLLARLEPYRRVVLLSGDVHYASGALMSYWRADATEPARIAQFTSSGLKNVMPAYITVLDRTAGFLQQLVRARVGVERLGWHRPAEDLVLLPDGMSERDLPPATRARLHATPVLVPTWGWPERASEEGSTDAEPTRSSRLNPERPPDWRWRITPLLDTRPDEARPEPIRPLALDHEEIDEKLADTDSATSLLRAYAAIARRHQHALGHLRNARQILFRSNFGLLRFESDTDGRLDAVHEVHTAFADPDRLDTAPPEPEPYLLQVASLAPMSEPEPEAPPAALRAAVIVPRPLPNEES